MKAIEFKEVNVRIVENQPEYETLPAHINLEDLTTPTTMCIQLDQEEVNQVIETGRIWIQILTFGESFHPISMSFLRPEGFTDPELKNKTAKKVCYCGSLRFKDLFEKYEFESVLKGEIALLPCCMFVDIEREYGNASEYKKKVDEIHWRKIDMCDEVFVINKDGYIGESTRAEIEYANNIGKPIRYMV